MTEHAVGEPFPYPHSFPCERQVGRSLVFGVQTPRRTNHLKAAVEQQRVNVLRMRFAFRGKADLAKGFPGPRPHRLQGPERSAQIDSEFTLGAVIVRHVDRRHGRFQRLRIKARRRFGRSADGFRQYASFRVQHPFLIEFALAEYLDPAFGVVSRRFEQNLQLAPAAFLPVAFLARENQRIMQLQVFHQHRQGILVVRRTGRHGAVERARSDERAENPVIPQPRGLGRMQIGFVSQLAQRRFMATSQ